MFNYDFVFPIRRLGRGFVPTWENFVEKVFEENSNWSSTEFSLYFDGYLHAKWQARLVCMVSITDDDSNNTLVFDTDEARTAWLLQFSV